MKRTGLALVPALGLVANAALAAPPPADLAIVNAGPPAPGRRDIAPAAGR